MERMRGFSPLERFEAKYAVALDGCWDWLASLSKSGYGKFKVDYKDYRAHRWSYEHYVGPIPADKQVDHLCNNRACVNPDHLRLATARENSTAGHSNAVARLNLDKTHCPRGHELAEWNLNTSSLARKERSCRVCNLARSRNRTPGRPPGWWMEEADRLYTISAGQGA